MQHIFNYMLLEDHERFACATNQSEKEAFGLWELMEQAKGENIVTWDRFSTLFWENYLGEARMSSKVHEFIDLKQGKMSVAEYTAKFDELACCAVSMVPSDKSRRNKYIHRLKIDIVK